jgi:peptidoglycan/xylan/chitin deacetylase (PgdA/CDA1 family)
LGSERDSRVDYSAITRRKDFDWPGGKRLAVWFSINIESFVYGVMHGIQWSPVQRAPDTTNWAWKEYGNRVGFWRLLELCNQERVPISALVNTRVHHAAPDIAAALKENGCEIVAHGRTNSEAQNMLDEAAERALVEETTAELTSVYGTRPVGWMSPGIDGSEVTADLLQELGYAYTLDWPLDDQPVWLHTRSGGRILSVPYPTEMNDITFIATHHGLASEFTDVIIDSFDEMLDQSAAQPLVFGISTHTFLSGQPGRIRQLRRALRYIHDHSDTVWWATSRQIAEHFTALEL